MCWCRAVAAWVYPAEAMTAPPGGLVAYHIGIVVHDLQAVADRYQRILGIDRWHTHELATVNYRGTSAARMHVSRSRSDAARGSRLN